MKLLVIGSGGREHALVWKLAQSPHVNQMWCAPGNAGIAQDRLARTGALIECVAIGAEDLPKLLAFAQEKKADLAVVGPDNPLALGIVGLFQKNRLRIWGPSQKAAQFEASKAFSQIFMDRHGGYSQAVLRPGARVPAIPEHGERIVVFVHGSFLDNDPSVWREIAQRSGMQEFVACENCIQSRIVQC